jgi:hypothetical protein
MGAVEHARYVLVCSQCRATGVAEWWETEGWMHQRHPVGASVVLLADEMAHAGGGRPVLGPQSPIARLYSERCRSAARSATVSSCTKIGTGLTDAERAADARSARCHRAAGQRQKDLVAFLHQYDKAPVKLTHVSESCSLRTMLRWPGTFNRY